MMTGRRKGDGSIEESALENERSGSLVCGTEENEVCSMAVIMVVDESFTLGRTAARHRPAAQNRAGALRAFSSIRALR